MKRSTYETPSVKTRLRWNWGYIFASLVVGALIAGLVISWVEVAIRTVP